MSDLNATANVSRVRELFEAAMSDSIDALFAQPDVVEVVSAVAAGDLAIILTGGRMQIVPALAADDAAPMASEAASDVQQHASEGDVPGMYL